MDRLVHGWADILIRDEVVVFLCPLEWIQRVTPISLTTDNGSWPRRAQLHRNAVSQTIHKLENSARTLARITSRDTSIRVLEGVSQALRTRDPRYNH